jgi:transposase
VAQAIEPHYTAIATQVRHAAVNYMDETPWCLTHTLQWLWVMVSDAAALYMIHPHRSKEAFVALIADWAGILVSDGYGVYRHWVQARQTCLAHLIRSARGLAARAQSVAVQARRAGGKEPTHGTAETAPWGQLSLSR